MAKGMSPLRIFMRNAPRKTVHENLDESSSGLDAGGAETQARQPLCPVLATLRSPLTSTPGQPIGDPSMPRDKSEGPTPLAKGKTSCFGQENFPHLENSEGVVSSINVTPDKNIMTSLASSAAAPLNSDSKFTWHDRQGSTKHTNARDGPLDVRTPPGSSKQPAAANADEALCGNSFGTQQMLSNNSREGDTPEGSIPGTAKTARVVKQKKVEVDRSRHDSISRTSILRCWAQEKESIVGEDSGDKFDAATVDCFEICRSSPDNTSKSKPYSTVNNDKKSRSVEALSVCAIRRELTAKGITKGDYIEEDDYLEEGDCLEEDDYLEGGYCLEKGDNFEKGDCLEIRRRLGISEVQISETITNLAAAQFSVEKSYREQDKGKLKEENDVHETELCNDIAPAELKSFGPKPSLKSGVEIVEAARFRTIELDKEILTVKEDAELSLSKVIKQQNLDNEVLRAKVREKDMTIFSARKQMEIAIANLKEADVEMDMVHRENERLTKTLMENNHFINNISFKLKSAEEELFKREIKIEGYESELRKMGAEDWETKMHNVENEWRRKNEALSEELIKTKLDSSERTSEAAFLLQKFQDGQATLKEAEGLVDALVRANEDAKHNAQDWESEKESLGIEQGWWMPEREKLVSVIARLESDMHTQQQDMLMTCKEAVIGLVETMDVLTLANQEISALKNDHHQEMEDLLKEMEIWKNDMVSGLKFLVNLRLDLEAFFTLCQNQTKQLIEVKCDHDFLPQGLQSSTTVLEQRSESGEAIRNLESLNYDCQVSGSSGVQGEALYFVQWKAEENCTDLVSKANGKGVQLKNCHSKVAAPESKRRTKESELHTGRPVAVEGAKCVSFKNMTDVVLQLTPEEDSAILENVDLRVDITNLETTSLFNYFREILRKFQRVSMDIAFHNEASESSVSNQRVAAGLEQQLQALDAEIEKVLQEDIAVKCQMRTLQTRVAALELEVGQYKHHLKDVMETHVAPNQQFETCLRLRQEEFAFIHETLMSTLGFCETLVSKMPDISVQCEELELLQSVSKLNHKFQIDFKEIKEDIVNFQRAAQEELHSWRLHVNVTEQENKKLSAEVQDLKLRYSVLEDQLDEERCLTDGLAEELMLKEQRMPHSLQMINSQQKAVESDRDKILKELVVLNEQLEMAQMLAHERDIVAAEARQVADLSISRVEEKEEEARILGRSVEELESTVYVLESQLGIVNQEAEKQRVTREALEKELESMKHQMALLQARIDSQQAQTLRDSHNAAAAKTELDRIVIEMKNRQIQARKSVESLQQECADKDVQLRNCKAHIAELMFGAEKQASENQHKLKTLEFMAEQLKVEERKVILNGGSVGKVQHKLTPSKVKGARSPFKCIGSGLAQHRTSEMDEELSAANRRIKEVEAVAASRQKEVFMLNTKLAEAESMTHDVVRDLLGVKTDIASYATLLTDQQVQHIAKARRHTFEAQQKLTGRDKPQAGRGCSGLC